MTIRQIKRLTEEDAFRARLDELDVELPLDTDRSPGGPLAQPLAVPGTGKVAGNRFCILPMEGWDGSPEGAPTDLVHRRWRRFGESGAKLIWGGEAVAVRHDGRANPHQLVAGDGLADLRRSLVDAHVARYGTADDLVVGLQLTHSGRWSRPDGPPAPRPAHAHPVLDARAPGPPFTDQELDALRDDFVAAAVVAQRAGFDFVDVKACHGYLGHELLSGVDRPGRYGGDLDGRSRFLRTTIEAIRAAVPDLGIGVRLSAFDLVPFEAGPDGTGVPVADGGAARFAFGADTTGLAVDLTEPLALLDLLADLGVTLFCVTAAPPEDPLVGVARLLQAAAGIKAARPALTVVGTGFSYLQEWLPPVARAMVGEGRMDAVGLGRMALSYPDLPADVLAGRDLDGRRLCRTFSDCTTAPRNGLVSGCWPLDDFYKQREDRVILAAAKRAGPRSGRS